MTNIWDLIDAQLAELGEAQTADDVMRILSRERNGAWHTGSGEGFFAGTGGDGTVASALLSAGWVIESRESLIYYALRAPNGDVVTYCEGDLDRGDRLS